MDEQRLKEALAEHAKQQKDEQTKSALIGLAVILGVAAVMVALVIASN